MAAKAILIFCAQALLVQGIYSQCIPGPTLAAEELLAGNALAYGALGAPYGAPYGFTSAPCGAIAPTSGGGFIVTSTSPISPTGITVVSENAMEGALSIAGELPFLGAIALEGALPSAGAGGINYGCGNGAVGILTEGVPPAYPGYGPAGLMPAGGLPGYPGSLGGQGFGRNFGIPGCGGVY